MPRSSRRKSSKYSSRESRDYSDSEKESSLKEKKGIRHSKEPSPGEKRKLDSRSVDIAKESTVSTVKKVYTDEYAAETVDNDRWTGGSNNEHELLKSDMKEIRSSSDAKRSSRRDEIVVSESNGEEGKSGNNVELKHHCMERKEKSSKEESKVSKSEILADGITRNKNIGREGNAKQGSFIDERGQKLAVGNTDFNIQAEFRSPESERDLDQGVRRKKDGTCSREKHQDGNREPDDVAKLERYKINGLKDERIRNKHPGDVVKVISPLDDERKDSQPSNNYTGDKANDRQVSYVRKNLDLPQKKSKHHSEYDRDNARERDRDHGRDWGRERARNRHYDRGRYDRDHEREREHDRGRDECDNAFDHDRVQNGDLERDHDRDHVPDRDRDRAHDRYRPERDKDRVRDCVNVRDRFRERDYDQDHDYGSQVDPRGARYKEDRGCRRSPDFYDDYHCEKTRRAESEVDKERSLSRKGHGDSVASCIRHRTPPRSRSCAVTDKYRDDIQDEIKCGHSTKSGTGVSEGADKVPKYRSSEKRTKLDDCHITELSERPPNTKASPACLKERSPSSTSVDHRSRIGTRRSLDVDETERRSGSNDRRDVPVNEDRQGRDFSVKKHKGEDYRKAESSRYLKFSQGNASSHGPGPSGFRTGMDSPSFIGSLGEESRGHSGSHYRRSTDPNKGRGPGNAWKVPNWPSPLPNGLVPFPPGPPGPHHGDLPPMMSQFPPRFGIRPPLEMNHPGIPFHMADSDRFPSHMRPSGLPNMIDGLVPPHFHGWDFNNVVLREESSMYHCGLITAAHSRDLNADMWKPSNDINMDVTSGSLKDASVVKASTDEISSPQGASRPRHESCCLEDQGTIFKNTLSPLSSMKEIPWTPIEAATVKTPESFDDVTSNYLPTYLAKLDISLNLTDRELYNQCVNIGVKGLTEYVEEDDELDLLEETAVIEPVITNLTMGLTMFPASKGSIFQRALALYKSQCSDRRSAATSIGEKLCSPRTEESSMLVVKELIPKRQVDGPVCNNAKEEEPTLVVVAGVPTSGQEEGKDTELALNVGDEIKTPVLDAGNMDGKVIPELISENVGSTHLDAIHSNIDIDVVIDGRIGSTESGSAGLLDVAVRGSLNLCLDSVKVCEALMPLSNESESVISRRIHHAPESTH